jgi:flagellar M-ring protein FliF
MMWFEELKNNLLALWQRMESKQRTGAIVAVSVVCLLVVGLAYWALHTNYEVLFSDLDERDAANIVADLKQSKTPYRLSDNGHRILVPESQVYETRLRLMGKGVLQNGGVGFEIFDNKDLGMTEYTQKINYQRALQGELSRTIMSMAPVKLARVQLVLAEASIFKHDKVKPKASVSLVLQAGAQLTNDQILGIQRLAGRHRIGPAWYDIVGACGWRRGRRGSRQQAAHEARS